PKGDRPERCSPLFLLAFGHDRLNCFRTMVYIASWDEFAERSVQLFRADPHSSRYVMKYRHCDGKLVLKVTDNREHCLYGDSLSNSDILSCSYIGTPLINTNDDVLQCLKFKTDQAQDAKKMEKLTNIFFTLMVRGPDGIVP
ncbi:unnamed protein product, partial [Musa acuminata subsp. burmannicoides]